MLYKLTGGDFKQIDFIENNFTLPEFYKYIGIKNLILKEIEDEVKKK